MSDKVNKFKVGDKIKRTREGWSDMPLGSVWCVSHVVDDEEVRVKGLEYSSWSSEYFELVNEEINTSQNELIKETIESQPIHSDGGSSDYYFTKLPKHMINQIVETGGIEIKDIIRYVFDNNADAFNIVKAQKRIVESLKGKGKAGITSLYDANKIRFFAEEQYNALNNKES